MRERAAGWGPEPVPEPPVRQEGAGRHYVSYPGRTASKADRVLGRSPLEYADEGYANGGVSMENLRPRGPNDPYEDISSDEEEYDQKALDGKPMNWPHRVHTSVHKLGVVTNTLLGNTLARQKDDVKGWDGVDEGVD